MKKAAQSTLDQCTRTTPSGFTALHLAIVKSRNEVAKMLMSELGAKAVGAVGESGITAAHVAASAGNYYSITWCQHNINTWV